MLGKERQKNDLIKFVFMVAISCVTQILTLLKSSIMANYFGVTADMDSINFANSIVTFVFSFVTAGIATVVMPCYIKKEDRKNLDAFLTILSLGILAIAIFLSVCSKPIISLATGRDQDFVNLTAQIIIILLMSNLFSVVTSVTSAYFQSLEKYNLPKIITLVIQLGVVGVLFFLKDITVIQYAIIFGAGIVINSILDLLVAIRCGWRYSPSLAVKEEKTKQIVKRFFPILLSTGVYQISLLVDTTMATRLTTGDVTKLNYANQISNIVNTLIVGNLLIYFYPKIVNAIEQKLGQGYFWDRTYFFHALICLVIVGYAVVGREGVAILFQRGKFTEDATTTVFYLSLIYISGQQINVIRDSIYRFFYANNDTKNTTVNSIITTIIHVVLSIVLVKVVGLYGVVLASTASSFVSLITIMIKMKKKYGIERSIMEIVFQYAKTIVITILTGAIVVAVKSLLNLSNMIVVVLVFGFATIIVYLGLTLLLNRKILQIAKRI